MKKQKLKKTKLNKTNTSARSSREQPVHTQRTPKPEPRRTPVPQERTKRPAVQKHDPAEPVRVISMNPAARDRLQQRREAEVQAKLKKLPQTREKSRKKTERSGTGSEQPAPSKAPETQPYPVFYDSAVFCAGNGDHSFRYGVFQYQNDRSDRG